jgi:hypothetical protein
MSNFDKIIRSAVGNAGSAAKRAGSSAVNMIKKHPVAAAGVGGIAGGSAITENSIQGTIEQLREAGYDDQQILNYLLTYSLDELQE